MLQTRSYATLALLVGAFALLVWWIRIQESSYNWGWYVILPTTDTGMTNIQFLLAGLGATITLSVLAILIAMVMGLIIALFGLSSDPVARGFNRTYVEIVRSVPVLVMLLWVHYGLPVILGLNFDVFASGVVALAICESAFLAEIFRGGVQSIARGQFEAADSLGLGYGDKMRDVILPQAVRRILPPLGNQFVYMLKMSSLVSVIGLGELTRQANELVTNQYRPLEIYTFLVLEYLVLILLVSWGVRWLERRLGADESRQR
ncbi:MAG: amino acid ABC transporter permease [Geminicoccaceae bacterium]